MRKTIIVDGNNLGWMAVGIAPLTHRGQRIEVIYVGLNMLRSYLKRFEPDKFYLVWDWGRDAERLKIYPDYKKRVRELTKDELKERDMFFGQMRKLQEVTKFLGIPQFRAKGREADDVIFNLIDKYTENTEFIVISTDKDFYQIFNKRFDTAIFNPVTKQIIEAKEVKEKYGIPISYFVDYRAMVGDPSDNLPGIKGIGEVWAAWLVNNILDGEIDHEKVSKPQSRMINLLLDEFDTFSLMKELIKFRDISKEELEESRSEDNAATIAELQERGIAICQEYGFEKHQRNFPSFIQPFENLWKRQNV